MPNRPVVDFEKDLILFKNALRFSKKFGYTLIFIDRLKKNYLPFLKQKFDIKDFIYISPQDSACTYKFFNEENLLIFNHSSLGYEFMARGFKCICFGHNSKYLKHGLRNDYKKEGIFWTSKINYENLKKKF